MVRLRLRADGEWGDGSGSVTTDAEARFAFDIAPETEPREVELFAAAHEDGRLQHGMYLPEQSDPLFVARVRRPWPDEPSATWEIDLVCERAPSISGRVLAADGRPTTAQAVLMPTGGGDSVRLDSGRMGELHFPGLLEPSYELEVRKPGRAAVRMSGLVPDGPPFTVRLDAPGSSRVVVRVSSPVDLAQTIVLTGELRPRAGLVVEAPDLPAQLEVETPTGWLDRQARLNTGTSSFSTDQGNMYCVLAAISGGEKVLDLDGGLWWFGATATARDGTPLFPVGTGLVRVTPGEHLVELHLVPTGPVVVGLTVELEPDERWLALARPGGPPIPLDVRAERFVPVVRCGTDGSFVWPMVPEGPLELRWGRREELLAGRATGVRALEVRRGETTTLEIEP
jgi:hypothetical protein